MKRKINGIVILAMMATAGCSSRSAVTVPEASGSKASSPKVSSPETSSVTRTATSPTTSLPSSPASLSGYGFDQWQNGPLGDVFFDFDSTALSADAQGQLKQNAAWLENNSANRVLIEGHCDSRGTAEYNMALGERRASTAKEYLVRLGIASPRLETLSFGEERPFDSGKGENAWAKNRRAHFVMKK